MTEIWLIHLAVLLNRLDAARYDILSNEILIAELTAKRHKTADKEIQKEYDITINDINEYIFKIKKMTEYIESVINDNSEAAILLREYNERSLI